jgi:hypothetical protein
MPTLDRRALCGRSIVLLLLAAGACGGTIGLPATDDASVAGNGGAGGSTVDAMVGDADVADAGVDAALADAGAPPAHPAFEALYDAQLLPTFEITLPQSSIDALAANPDIYQTGTLRYGDMVLDNVGVRLKGRASFQGLDEKPGLKIKVNEFVAGQRLLGLKRITLNNMIQDPSMVRERLAYAVFREAGVPAPLCNHARVYINGEYYGLYANIQTLDEEFVKSRWRPAPGNLYDITNTQYNIDFEREKPTFFNRNPPPTETLYVLETNTTLNDTSDLTEVINAVSTTPDALFFDAVGAVMDWDEVLLDGAVQAVIADWDGYFGARNNYKAYHELGRNRFVLFPWGVDQTFGIQDNVYNKVNYNIDHSNSERTRSLIYDRCARSTVCQTRYFAQVALAVDAFDRLALATMLDAILAQITPSILEDTRRPYSNATHDTGVVDLRDFLSRRSAIVRAQLP